jgi:ketosteroid isomerase-like protein
MHAQMDLATDALATLQKFNKAEQEYLLTGNFDELRKLFAPDAVIYQAAGLPYGGEHRGHAALENAFSIVRDTWQQIETLETRSLIIGDEGAIWERVRFTSRRTGKVLTTEVFILVTVRDGIIVEARPFYLDTLAVREAITP